MGDPIKAEKVATHFATPASPTLATTPFGNRQIPTTPAVNFEHALLTATRTNGNRAPLFLMRSIAIDPITGNSFVPLEGLTDNPVEGSLSTSHGHVGLLYGPAYPPTGLPAAINAGVLVGPGSRCTAELQAVLMALAERMANEFMESPFGFMSEFDSASREAGLKVLGNEATGFWSWLKSVPGKLVDAYNWLEQKEAELKSWALGQAIRAGRYVASGEAWADIKHSTERAGNYVLSGEVFSDIESGIVSTAEAAKAAFDFVQQIPYEDILDACVEALKDILGEAGCAMLANLQAMLADPRSMATQLGEIHGTVGAHAAVIAIETAGAIAVDVVATKGAATAASRVGLFIARSGGKVANFADTVGARVRQAYARRARASTSPPEAPSSVPASTPARAGNKADEVVDAPHQKNDGVESQDNNGRAAIACQSCP